MRHIREGVKNIARNGWMTLASILAVTTTLVLVGVFLALVFNLNEMAKSIESDVQISTLIDATAEEDDILELGEEIEQLAGVDTVQFSSNEEELEKLVQSMGDQGSSWELFEQDNPLNHVYIVQAEEPEQTEQIASEIGALSHVQEVNYGEEVVQQLFKFNNYARTIGLGLIVALVLTAVFLISNTIKITIMARSREIGIMKLVGATNGFIRWPFFVEGMILGALGSVVPIAVILAGYYYVENNATELLSFSFVEILPFNPFALQLSLVILIIGVVIGVLGSLNSVRRFLKV